MTGAEIKPGSSASVILNLSFSGTHSHQVPPELIEAVSEGSVASARPKEGHQRERLARHAQSEEQTRRVVPAQPRCAWGLMCLIPGNA